MMSNKWDAKILKMVVPIEAWGFCYEKISRYNTCKIIKSTTFPSEKIVFIHLAFRPIADEAFIARMVDKIDNWAEGKLYVVRFCTQEVETW